MHASSIWFCIVPGRRLTRDELTAVDISTHFLPEFVHKIDANSASFYGEGTMRSRFSLELDGFQNTKNESESEFLYSVLL